ncbi:hypothetical protein B4067_1529 [Bacillus subtilis subsp. subtilis]|uniref:Uncharacterized protein n=1 Tax=Bacillus subtilis subsp. subtilis TaxID=135461 RepID=A0ABD4A0R5_BACIU|nr:hypothetical protein B4067_1529 [Bacillus subtilis subsp. subtilis]
MISKFGFSMHDWRNYTSQKIKRLFEQVKKDKQAMNSDSELITEKGQFHLYYAHTC